MVSVFLFVPNLIGYARVVLALVGYAVALSNHHVMFFCYLGSQLLDAFDGLAARKLGQSSQFGARLPRVRMARGGVLSERSAAAAQVPCSTW